MCENKGGVMKVRARPRKKIAPIQVQSPQSGKRDLYGAPAPPEEMRAAFAERDKRDQTSPRI